MYGTIDSSGKGIRRRDVCGAVDLRCNLRYRCKIPGELFNFLCVAALLREDHALCGFLNLYFMLLNLRNAEDAMEPALLSATGVFGEKDRVNHRRLYR